VTAVGAPSLNKKDEQSMSMKASWADLRDHFVRHVSNRAAPSRLDWHHVWQTLVCDPWYQQQLFCCARKLLRRSNRPSDWLEEVQQEAMTILGRQLRLSPDLHVDMTRVHEHFAPWMRWIIYRTCQEALRRLRRMYGKVTYLTELELLNLTIEDDVETHVEISLAIGSLQEPQRTVMVLYTEGANLKGIAVEMGLNYWRTYRLWQDALCALRARFDGQEQRYEEPCTVIPSGTVAECANQHKVA
jgi:DNA-directed RNA polymerase specialized sigma24 family protein